VKRARKTLVDPILARFEQISSPEPLSSEEEADPELVRRQQEKDKIRYLNDLPSKRSSLALVSDTGVGVRIRRPTIKKAHLDGTGNIKEGTEKSKISSTIVPLGPPPDPQPSPEDITLPENPPEDLKSKRKLKGIKPKPETYKQSWSVSEQNLLEQLLEEIPDGEKFRHVFFPLVSSHS
jgi:hypothetical protein